MVTSKLHADGIVLLEGSKPVDELGTSVSMDVVRVERLISSDVHAGSEFDACVSLCTSLPPKFKIISNCFIP